MREIGGYLELERNKGQLYHENAIGLNCGRAAIEYLIQGRNIKKMYLPFFCCDAIVQPCLRKGIKVEFYHIDKGFQPLFNKNLGPNDWLYIINFYGQLSNDILLSYKERFNRIIIDNAHAYYQSPLDNVDTVYTCRKYFGVSDGAFLYTDVQLEGLPYDYSYERIRYVLGRFEKNASNFYQDAVCNNESFDKEPLKLMSKLTCNFLKGIDYEYVKEKRSNNFKYIHNNIGDKNNLKINLIEGPFMYPFYCERGVEIRNKLQRKKIYIPILWPYVFDICKREDLEYNYAENILPIPIDQRYELEDMEYIIQELKKEGI